MRALVDAVGALGELFDRIRPRRPLRRVAEQRRVDQLSQEPLTGQRSVSGRRGLAGRLFSGVPPCSEGLCGCGLLGCGLRGLCAAWGREELDAADHLVAVTGLPVVGLPSAYSRRPSTATIHPLLSVRAAASPAAPNVETSMEPVSRPGAMPETASRSRHTRSPLGSECVTGSWVTGRRQPRWLPATTGDREDTLRPLGSRISQLACS